MLRFFRIKSTHINGSNFNGSIGFFLSLFPLFPFLLFLRGEWTRAKCKNEPYSSLMLTHINIEAELFFISMIFNDGKWGISQFLTAAYSSDSCVLFITWICAFCRTYMFHMQMHSRDASWKRFKYIRLFPFFLSLQHFFSLILISFLFESLENCGVDTEFPNYILLNLNDVFVCCCFSVIRSFCVVNIGSNETEVCMHVHMHLYFLLFQYRHECVCLKSIQFSHE